MKTYFNILINLVLVFGLSSCDSGGGGGSSATPTVPSIPSPSSLCSDLNSSNVGLALPCVCNLGYTLSTDGKSCSLTPTPPGVTYTYSSIFSGYSPLQSATTPCAGTVSTSRTMTCQRSDSVIVPNSSCSADPSPTSSVLSRAGTTTVSSTNPSLSNGVEQMTCTVGSTTGTRVVSCNSNYHLVGSSLATYNCESNVISCSSMPNGASVATQTWNGSAYGSCVISTCNTAQNYVKIGSSCVRCGLGETAQVNNTCTNSDVSEKLSHFQGSGIQIVSSTQTKAWGSNSYGQLGVGDTSSKGSPVNLSFPVGRYPIKIQQNVFGSSYYAIMDNGSLMAWGNNGSGQLGLGSSVLILVPTVVNLGSGKTVKRLAVGSANACAVLNDYSLSCWGSNDSGELGLGYSSASVTTPQPVNLGSGRTVYDIEIIDSNTNTDMMCVITDDYSLKCSGYNLNGQLGDGTTISKTSLTTVSLGSGVLAKDIMSITGTRTSVSSCVIDQSNNLRCWGNNYSGILGVGDFSYRSTPTLVNLGVGMSVKKLFVSNTGQNVCSILNDDSLKCWGLNNSGQLGDGTYTDKNTPTAINLGVGRTAKHYANSNSSSYVILDNNTLLSWGFNTSGQLGVSGSSPTTPQVVNLGGNTVKSIKVSDYLACLVTMTNGVMCAGINLSGSVGNGILGGAYNSFQNVSLGSGRTALELKSSAYSSCALLDNNTVKCWGSGNSGQLGNNSFTSSATPVLVQ